MPASAFDPEPTEGELEFRDFCARTGWQLACSSAQMQVFYNEGPDPLPIETDPALELETIHRAAKRSYLPAYFVLLLMDLLFCASLLFVLTSDPIGTLAAQQMVSVAEESQTPVIYGTVSYPEVANLTGIDYVTGTSDALNVELLLDMMLAADPDVQTVGLLYSTSEVNSAPAIEEAKAYLDEKGISYLEKTGTTSDEIIAAVNSMLGQVDAVFTPTDNAVQATELAIAPILAEAGIPHYAGADSFVRNGAFATCGVNYTDLGTQTADLAVEVLQTGEFPEYVTVSGDIITVNTDTAATLGLDYSLFQDMGSQVVEVQTTQD